MSVTKIRAAELRRIRLAECRDCHEPIRFVRLNTGSLIPVNPRENPSGSVAASINAMGLVGFVISKDHRPGPLTPYRFMPHAATCSERKPEPKAAPDPDESLW